MRTAAVLFSLLALCVTASAAAPVNLGIGGRPFPYPWRQVTKKVPHPTETIHLWFSLKQQNLNVLRAKALEVSNPRSSSYGQYLSIDEITAIVQPARGVVSAVEKWVREQGVSEVHIHPNNDVIRVVLPVSVAERMLNVKYKYYQHALNYRVIIRTEDTPTLPAHLMSHIDHILGVKDFPAFKRHGQAAMNEAVATAQRKHAEAVKRVQARHERTRTSVSVHTRRGRAHPRPAPQATSNVVNFTLARGGEQSLTVTFNVICSDGQPATSAPPCGAAFPLDLTFTDADGIHATLNASVQVDSTICTGSPLSCVAGPFKVDNYVNYNISGTATIGGAANTAYAPYVVVASPNVVPERLQKLYNIPRGLVVTHQNATQAVVEFEQQYYSPSDLDMYLSELGLPQSKITVVGPNDATNPGGEANLDIQWILGVAPGAPTTFWSIKANSTAEIDDILKWAYAMGNTTNPPLVNSLSYGMSEANVDKYLGTGYTARSDVEFTKLAARGLTVIIACGDTGAGDLGGPPMGMDTCEVLHPDWPSQSSWVTALGSTYITPYDRPVCYKGANATVPPVDCSEQALGEVVVSLDHGMRWTTGGGFSNVVPRPSYQSAAVDSYLAYLTANNISPPSTAFNSSNRAYPDVATVGHNLLTALSGQFVPIDGTSASAPIFAGLVTLLNNARLNAGKAPLGFLNQLLYQYGASVPETFYDVTVGNNKCGSYGPGVQCCEWGFSAAVGWDAASGLGSPDYRQWAKIMDTLP